MYLLGTATQWGWIWPASAAHPEWGAYATHISGGNTEMADALRNKIPAITLTGMTRRGHAPYWHQVGDTYDKIDGRVLNRAYAFTWAYLHLLDENSRPPIDPRG